MIKENEPNISEITDPTTNATDHSIQRMEVEFMRFYVSLINYTRKFFTRCSSNILFIKDNSYKLTKSLLEYIDNIFLYILSK